MWWKYFHIRESRFYRTWRFRCFSVGVGVPHAEQATQVKRGLAKHGVICAEDGKPWEVPEHGILIVQFIEEPNADRTIGEVGPCDFFVRHHHPNLGSVLPYRTTFMRLSCRKIIKWGKSELCCTAGRVGRPNSLHSPIPASGEDYTTLANVATSLL